MHEASLIQYVLDAVEKRALKMGIRHVESIRLIIGEERGALPHLMEYSFHALAVRRPLFMDTRLEMISVKGNELMIDSFTGD